MRLLPLAYFAYFLYLGSQSPYWAIWLHEVVGLEKAQVGEVFQVFTLSILAGGLTCGHLSDRRRMRRGLQRATSLLGVAVCLAWTQVQGLGGALALAVPFGIAVGGQIPLLDATAVDGLGLQRERYGRLRLFGTLGFATASGVLGFLREGHPERIIVWMTAGFFAWHLVTWVIPDTQPHEAPTAPRPARPNPLTLLRRGPIALLALSTFLHTLAFASREIFGALHFEDTLGLSGQRIAALYQAEMVAEVGAFMAVPRLLRLFHPLHLMLTAHLLTAFRWFGTASTDHFPTLLGLETLHAATYGLWWGSLVQLLGSLVGTRLRTTGQALMSMAFAIGMGCGGHLAGAISERFPSHTTFAVAGGISLLNALLILLTLPAMRRRGEDPVA